MSRRIRRLWPRWWLPGVAVFSAIMSLAASDLLADPRSEAAGRLKQAFHLTPAGGGVWLTNDEVHLQEHLAELPKLRKRALQLEKDLTARMDGNRSVWQTRQQAEATLQAAQQAARTIKISAESLARMKEQVELLKTQSVEPASLGGVPAIRELSVQLVAQRNEVFSRLALARGELSASEANLKKLRDDAELKSALAQAGPEQRLSSAGEVAAKARELGALEATFLSPRDSRYAEGTPLYLEGKKLRICGLIRETQPATFTWRASGGANTITASQLEAAGIAIPADAPVVVIRPSAGRELRTRQVSVGPIRFGPAVLREVTFLALPPEGEDLGSQLGGDAFGGYSVSPEPDQLRLAIRKSP